MFFRKVIYIGEYNGQTVYINVDNPEIPLSSSKSMLIDKKSTHGNRNAILWLSFFILGSNIVLQFFPKLSFFREEYSLGTVVYFLSIWFVECLLFLFLTERAFYKNVKHAKTTDSKAFKQAVKGNLIWNNFSDKKISIKKKIFAWCITLLVAILGLGGPLLIIWIVLTQMIDEPLGSEVIPLSLMGGADSGCYHVNMAE